MAFRNWGNWNLLKAEFKLQNWNVVMRGTQQANSAYMAWLTVHVCPSCTHAPLVSFDFRKTS